MSRTTGGYLFDSDFNFFEDLERLLMAPDTSKKEGKRDKAILEKLDVWKDWSEHITFNPVSVQEIKDFHAKLMKALAQEGATARPAQPLYDTLER